MAIIFWTLILSGCVAQQADLARVQKDLEDQIKLLNQEKQELKTIISQNREEAETLREQQNADMKDLFGPAQKFGNNSKPYAKLTSPN